MGIAYILLTKAIGLKSTAGALIVITGILFYNIMGAHISKRKAEAINGENSNTGAFI